MPRALVTGGAGLIGSHLVDLLLDQGWEVRLLDNLEPLTHAGGPPDWVPAEAESIWGDVSDPAVLPAALDGVETVFHLAAYGGLMPEIARFVEANCLGTARLLEAIRDRRLPVRKLVLASSQVVYVEGAVDCVRHGLQFPPRRSAADLAAGRFEVPCPVCGGPVRPALTPESAPVAGGTVYALTKLDQERLTEIWSAQTGIPTVALRFPCTYGSRQSPRNPYTGVISIFATRLLNGLPPLLYEDGRQTRDVCHARDVARACLVAAGSGHLDGRAVNVGSGQATSVRELAEATADAVEVDMAPELTGLHRPGDLRALVPDVGLIRAAGFTPSISLAEGLAEYVGWLRDRRDAEDRFAAAVAAQRARGMVRAMTA